MSSETETASMFNEVDTSYPEFGEVYPDKLILRLGTESDRDRGFLTESDREYLIKRNLEGQTERNARLRIRDRILEAYFDARYLRYVSDTDRQIIFENAGEDYPRNFRYALKELIRFTQRGLAEFNVDTTGLLEKGIEEAERSRAISDGKVVDVNVNIDIERSDETDGTKLEQQFKNHARLTEDELAALVNNPHTNIDVVDILYYQARKPSDEVSKIDSSRSSYPSSNPDKERAEEIVAELRELIAELNIESLDDYETAFERLRLISESDEYNHRLHELVRELDEVAPNFVDDMAERVWLSESDMELMHDIIWNPHDESIESLVRPRTAGEDWVPSQDKNLQKFIARVEVAIEHGSTLFRPSRELNRDRWDTFCETVGYDPDQWESYKEKQRFDRCKKAVEHLLDSTDELSRSRLSELLKEADELPDTYLADSSEDLQESMDHYHGDGEVMRQFEAFRIVLPPDANTIEFDSAMANFGMKRVLEAIRELAEDSEEKSK